MRVATCLVTAAAIATAGGCHILAGLDDYDMADTTASTSTTSTATGGGAGGDGDQGGAGGAGGGGDAVNGLIVIGDPASTQTVTVERPGLFQIDFTSAAGWQLASWYDLATDPVGLDDLAGYAAPNGNQPKLLFDPFQISNAGSSWYGAADSTNASLTVSSMNPVRVELEAQNSLDAWNATTRYVIWASGRIGVKAELTGAGSPLDCEYFYTSTSLGVGWEKQPDEGTTAGYAYWFDGSAEPSRALLVVDASLEPLREEDYQGGMQSGTARYWSCIADPAPVERGQLHVGLSQLGASDVAARGAQAASAEATLLSPATNATFEYNVTLGGYDVMCDVDQSPVVVPLPATDRYEPSLTFSNWKFANWSLAIEGQVIASSNAPATPSAIAFYDDGNDRLDVVFVGKLPDGSVPTNWAVTLASGD